ncbi:hypothetical protein MVES_000746 [Malassezia vespertilionis]|uniref:Ato2p n=2 Tax=Malassezia vespertilionis TaxID=2020962 RepID=A0A2N1JEQ7_9BASI|nr:hypothetical protein MVES_000746 [Malassezia vespertilionis]
MESLISRMSPDEQRRAVGAARFGYGPLAHIRNTNEPMLTAFGGEMQPGLYKGVKNRKFANPAPLGLSAFACTTFLLSLINCGTLGLNSNAVVIGLAFAYGGFVQVLAGMWEMAVGNTFGATALTSYGGFWMAFAILLTPGGFHVEDQMVQSDGTSGFLNGIGLFLMAWFIFTFILCLCSIKSTVMFFLLFFTLDLCFLLLGIAHIMNDGTKPNTPILRAGGAFGLATSFLAWYNAFAGLADNSNSFIIARAIYFPWTDVGVMDSNLSEKDDSPA